MRRIGEFWGGRAKKMFSGPKCPPREITVTKCRNKVRQMSENVPSPRQHKFWTLFCYIFCLLGHCVCLATLSNACPYRTKMFMFMCLFSLPERQAVKTEVLEDKRDLFDEALVLELSDTSLLWPLSRYMVSRARCDSNLEDRNLLK